MHRPFKLSAIATLLIVLILACTSSPIGGNNAVETQPPVEPGNAQPTELVPPAEPVQPPQPTNTPEPIATAEPTAEPLPTEIIHLVSPIVSVLSEKPQVIYDQESIRKAAQKEAYSGDEFLKGRYERPFDQDMNYLPFIDIKETDLVRTQDSEFIYAYIYLMEDPTLKPDEEYGFGIEMDDDLDGRGDYLVWTTLPQSKEWSTDGVSVWKDANNNIGGPQPVISDAPAGEDGYELNIFDSGIGADPDLAWSRISPEKTGVIEIAVKVSVLETSPKFLWGAWSMLGPGQFGLFDHNDYFTFEQAGSPMKSDNPFYPVNEMFALDNTCRAASGFSPQGYEPGLCPVTPQNCHKVCQLWVNVGAGRICALWESVCK